MILLTMILIIAALAIVIIGFVMDRLAIRKMQSGMRTINKRIRKIEKTLYPDPIEGLSAEDYLLIKAQQLLAEMDTEDTTIDPVKIVGWEIGGTDNDSLDTKTDSDPEGDPETPEEDSSALPDETEGEV